MAEKTTGNKDKSPPQKLKERPLSPHLTIYKPQISSVMSISHRLSGIYLAFGAIVFAIWVCTIACGPDTHGILTYLLTTKIGYLFVFAWSLAIFYHLLNGIRHLFWDVGLGFSLPVMTKSGIAVIIGALALTTLSWYLAFYCPCIR